jgi:O-antigen/teichoic acid export membrane protein
MESKQGRQTDISKHAVQNTFWAYMSFLLGKGLTFVATIILARLLAPEQFGLMGYCLIAIQYLDILNTFGMDTALISRRDKLEPAANAAFMVSIGMSVLLFGLAWFSAPVIAAFFDEARVIELFRLLAFVLPISALAMVPRAMIKRNLRFKAKLIPDIGHNLAKGLASILLAWSGFGVWSLIWGQLIGEVVSTLALWWVARWRPTFQFERQVTREMLSFGGHMISVGLVGALRNNIDYLFVGRVLGAAALGYYTIAYRIPELVIRNLNFVVGNVAHPLLARLQADSQHLRSVYFSYIRYISLFTFPAGVGIALTADPFIRFFYTSKWEAAIFPMQCVALALAIASVGHVPGVLYKAVNRPEILNQTTLVKMPVTIAALWYATGWGINGVAASQVALAIFYVVLDSVVVSRIIEFRMGAFFKALAPALAGSAVMAAALVLVNESVSPTGLAGLITLIIVGLASYLGTLAFVSRETVAQAYTVVMRAAVARS